VATFSPGQGAVKISRFRKFQPQKQAKTGHNPPLQHKIHIGTPIA